MLDLHSITLSYRKNVILQDCSYHFEESNIIGIVAPNGFGKTTLFNAIVNLKRPAAGTITISQQAIHNNRASYLKSIFFLESSSNLYNDFTATEMINYTKYIWNSTMDVEKTIDWLQITSYKNKKVKKLSLGMKQNVLLACAIISQAKVIILDEPFNGLDPIKQEQLIHILGDLKKNNKLILFSSHDLDKCVEICDKVLFLHNHTLTEHSTNSKHELESTFKQYFS